MPDETTEPSSTPATEGDLLNAVAMERLDMIAYIERLEAERDLLADDLSLAVLRRDGAQAQAESIRGELDDVRRIAARLSHDLAIARAELAEARKAGTCGAEAPALPGGDIQHHCILPALHHGWHKDATGSQWNPLPSDVEYRIEVRDDNTWLRCFVDQDMTQSPQDVLTMLQRVRANDPEATYRAAVRYLPPFRPLTDEQLTALANDTRESQ